jgi:hypothetical protein
MIKLIINLGLAACLTTAAGAVSAHGPTRQKVVETIQIDAPASAVWDIIGDFGSAEVWLPMVTGSSSEGGNEEGATRTLELGPKAHIIEILKKHSDEKMSYTYRIPVETHDVSVLPVNNYSSTLSVKDQDGGSIVTWKGAFYRGYPNNDPPPELNDEAAVAAVTAVYKAGLENLKVLVESRK